MPEVPQAAKTAAPKANPYGITTVNQGGYVPLNGSNVVTPEVERPVYPISNRAAGLSVFFGLIAVAFTLVAALPGSQTLWICGASFIAVIWGARGILRRMERRATNLWAPIVGILLALGAAAVALLGVNMISIVNSATGGIIPVAETTTTTHVAPQSSAEPFVFASNNVLTSDGQAVQQIATALNRSYASGNPTLSSGETWPHSLKFTDTQVLADSGTPLVTVPAGYTFTYKLSADQTSYSFAVTSGDRTESAIYYSATNKFSFSCPATDTNCVPVH